MASVTASLIAMAAGTAVGAGASIYAGSTQASAAARAANAQTGMFERLNNQQLPYIAAGYGGLKGLEELMGVPTTPGLTGALGQGGQPIDQAATMANLRKGLQSWSAAYPGNAEPIIQMIDSGAPLSAVASALQSLRATTTNEKNTQFLDPLIQQANNPVMGAATPGAATGQPTSSSILERLQQTPGYQFTLQQGLQAAQSGFAAQGLGQSGPAMKGAATFAAGLADQTYNTRVNQFMDLSKLGANVGQNMADLGLRSQGLTNAQMTDAAASQAAGAMGAGRAIQNALMFAGQQGMFEQPGVSVNTSSLPNDSLAVDRMFTENYNPYFYRNTGYAP